MRKDIRIRDRVIAEDQPIFIAAEIGVTCNYDMKITKELIDVVHDTGADAVKLIFWFPEELMSDHTETYTYMTVNGPVTENLFEMVDKLRFTLDEWREIKAYADSKNVILFCSPDSPTGIAWAEELKLEAYKISSWDFNAPLFWRTIAETGKPMIIDTGPVSLLELTKCLDIMKKAGNDQSILVHDFHTHDYAEMNMRAIPYLRQTFDSLVGYSPAGRSTETDIMALTLGAVYMEKRLTLSRSLPGHHHAVSMEPKEFEEYVAMMRKLQGALGEFALKPSKADLADRERYYRRIVANQDIPAGTILTQDMLAEKRPAQGGVSPEYMGFFIGRKTNRDLKFNEPVCWEDV